MSHLGGAQVAGELRHGAHIGALAEAQRGAGSGAAGGSVGAPRGGPVGVPRHHACPGSAAAACLLANDAHAAVPMALHTTANDAEHSPEDYHLILTSDGGPSETPKTILPDITCRWPYVPLCIPCQFACQT